MPPVLERSEPRISVNQLGLYLTAPATTRHRVVRNQKRPRGFPVAYYQQAVGPIIEALIDRERADHILTREAERLAAIEGTTGYQAQRRGNCIEALEAFKDIVDRLDLDRFEVIRAPYRAPRLNVGGVDISVRPELLLRDRETGEQGAIKLYFSVTNALSDEAGLYIATLLQQFVEQEYEEATGPALVIDVFAGRVFEAPRDSRKLQREIAAGCTEISALWSMF